MPDNWVIFITEFDPFNKNLPVYHVKQQIQETGEVFEDGSNLLFVNGAWQKKDPIGMLMHDFNCEDPDEMYYPVLAERARYFKKQEKGKKIMRSVFDEIREEGREEVREEAKKALLANATQILKDKVMKPEDVSKYLKLPLEEVLAIQKDLENE